MPDKTAMYYVYILKSSVNKDLYIGFSRDLKRRLEDHNGRKVRSTKGYAPWELIYYEAYKSVKDATRREKQLKNHQQKNTLRDQIRYSYL